MRTFVWQGSTWSNRSWESRIPRWIAYLWNEILVGKFATFTRWEVSVVHKAFQPMTSTNQQRTFSRGETISTNAYVPEAEIHASATASHVWTSMKLRSFVESALNNIIPFFTCYAESLHQDASFLSGSPLGALCLLLAPLPFFHLSQITGTSSNLFLSRSFT